MREFKANNANFDLYDDSLHIKEKNVNLIITEDGSVYINTQPNNEKKIKEQYPNFMGNIEIDKDIVFESFLLENCHIDISRYLKRNIEKASVVIKNSEIMRFELFKPLEKICIFENLYFSIEDSLLKHRHIMIASKNLELNLKNFKNERKVLEDPSSTKLVYYCEDKLNINTNNTSMLFIVPFSAILQEKIELAKLRINYAKNDIEEQEEILEAYTKIKKIINK